MPESEKLTKSLIIISVDGSSKVMIVASTSLIHSFMQTSNNVGDTGGGSAKTTHTVDLHMLLETHNYKMLLAMKHAYVMSSSNHSAFGLSPFLIHRCKRVSHMMHESINLYFDDNNLICAKTHFIQVIFHAYLHFVVLTHINITRNDSFMHDFVSYITFF